MKTILYFVANPCGIGQFYYNKNITWPRKRVYQRCKLCPRGTYNDHDADISKCSMCGSKDGTFGYTKMEGATSRQHCGNDIFSKQD